MYVCVLCDRHVHWSASIGSDGCGTHTVHASMIFTAVDSMRLVNHHVTAFDKCG